MQSRLRLQAMAWYAVLFAGGLLAIPTLAAVAVPVPAPVPIICSCNASTTNPGVGFCAATYSPQGGAGCYGCGANGNGCATCQLGQTCNSVTGNAQNNFVGSATCTNPPPPPPPKPGIEDA